VRAEIIYAFYGGEVPKKHRERDEDGKPAPREAPSKGITASKVAAMRMLGDQIRAAKASSIPPDE
jgi:hypothetical protein